MGKQFHKSFSKESTLRANEPLQEIHADVCGPMKPYLFCKKIIFSTFY
jgi:hypothetical protein